MWDLIVSVPDHCLSFYFGYNTIQRFSFWYMISYNAILRFVVWYMIGYKAILRFSLWYMINYNATHCLYSHTKSFPLVYDWI